MIPEFLRGQLELFTREGIATTATITKADNSSHSLRVIMHIEKFLLESAQSGSLSEDYQHYCLCRTSEELPLQMVGGEILTYSDGNFTYSFTNIDSPFQDKYGISQLKLHYIGKV